MWVQVGGSPDAGGGRTVAWKGGRVGARAGPAGAQRGRVPRAVRGQGGAWPGAPGRARQAPVGRGGPPAPAGRRLGHGMLAGAGARAALPAHQRRAPAQGAVSYPELSLEPLARIIHQPEKSTREGPFGGQMILNTTVSQDHHAPKASSSDGLGSVQIGLSVAIRRTASWQPPRADNHRFALEPPDVSMALTGPATSDVHTLTTLNSASIPAPPGTTRATKS